MEESAAGFQGSLTTFLALGMVQTIVCSYLPQRFHMIVTRMLGQASFVACPSWLP